MLENNQFFLIFFFSIKFSENDATGLKWKWVSVKAGGYRPAPRSGVNVAVAANGKAYIFGGVLDVNEDEESLDGQFSNEMHVLDLTSLTWRLVELKGKKEIKAKSKDNEGDDDEMEATPAEAQTSQGIVGNSAKLKFNQFQ